MKYIVRNHRQRKRITLQAKSPGSDKVRMSISVAVEGRTIEFSDAIVARYADAILELLERGELIEIATPEG